MLRVGLALCLAGCGALGADAPTNRCESDGECAAGSCDADLGMCVGDARSSITVGLEVLPATDPFYGGSPRAVTFEPFEVEGPTVRPPLVLSPGIPVVGLATDGLGQPLTADVSFATGSEIPGVARSAVSAQARAETTRDDDGFDFNFATQLLPGTVYDVTVRPTGAYASQLPPLRARYMTPGDGRHRLPLSYPEPCPASVMNDPTSTESCLATVQGVIADGAGEPQDGMTVRIIDPVTGRTLSSTYTTGSDPELDPGLFRVTFPVEHWRDQESWLFRVIPTATRLEERGPSQAFSVAPSALYEEDGLIW